MRHFSFITLVHQKLIMKNLTELKQIKQTKPTKQNKQTNKTEKVKRKKQLASKLHKVLSLFFIPIFLFIALSGIITHKLVSNALSLLLKANKKMQLLP